MDRLLPVWIIAAMAAGLAASTTPLPGWLHAAEVGGISVPIAAGLLVMMYPPLAKVRYDKAVRVAGEFKVLVLSVLLNWVLGPALMFALAWAFLADAPQLRTGVIIVGLARCIAMVLIWSDLACGDRELTAVLVAINSVFQVAMFAVLGWFYLQVLPGWLGLESADAAFSFRSIVVSVLIFLGIPLAAGIASRLLGEAARGRAWYEDKFLPAVSPLALIGLLYTIAALFCLQGQYVLSQPGTVARVAIPLLCYFIIMFAIGLGAARAARLNYSRSTSLAFTAAGNNFELAIAVAIGTFGAASGQALAGTVGPLIEVPVLVALVYVLRALGPRLFPGDPSLPVDGVPGDSVPGDKVPASGRAAQRG
ncbi:ACR3 family arsenite efflux transporter [Corynebacterium lizhenjunii]|uniref:ACR3 family arsenite efflux transporter n=1 Tax=Corynebacterium lizhenjunii TaxID=2709394 RepID=A0A7T0KIG9_9CORY|nr:ACR3 family arsenite efflux transporter [Corynebacterium lizhenjunii]QPK80328.1 ACR3 family arsenite efflux transporter [Corynebacterium lizhenjunii]